MSYKNFSSSIFSSLPPLSFVAYSEIDVDIVRELRRWSQSHLAHRLDAAGVATSRTAGLQNVNPLSHHAASVVPVTAGGGGGGHAHPPGGAPTISGYHRTFAQLDQRGFFDFVCAIIHVDPTGSQLDPISIGSFATGMAYIWDGTDLANGIKMQRRILPPGMELPTSTGGAKSFTPRLGSVLPISYFPQAQHYFDEAMGKSRTVPPQLQSLSAPSSSVLPPPCFALLRNIPWECDGRGEFFLKLSSKSKLFPLQPDDPQVVRMMDRYSGRLAEEAEKEKIAAWANVQIPITGQDRNGNNHLCNSSCTHN